MDRYGRNVADRFHIPDFPKQLFFGKNMVRVLCKEGQQVEFLCRKCFLFAVNPYTPCRFVDFQATDFYNIVCFLMAARQPFIPRHMRLDARYQLARRKRFRHIVVCAQTQAPDFVDVILFRTHHQDRDIFLLPDPAAYLKPINAGQHQIQHDQVKILFQCARKSFVTRIFDLYIKSAQLQIILFQICNCHFIFDN